MFRSPELPPEEDPRTNAAGRDSPPLDTRGVSEPETQGVQDERNPENAGWVRDREGARAADAAPSGEAGDQTEKAIGTFPRFEATSWNSIAGWGVAIVLAIVALAVVARVFG